MIILLLIVLSLQCIGFCILISWTYYLVDLTNSLFEKIRNLENQIRMINFKRIRNE